MTQSSHLIQARGNELDIRQSAVEDESIEEDRANILSLHEGIGGFPDKIPTLHSRGIW